MPALLLGLNATSCLIFGILFLILPVPVGNLLGAAPPTLIGVLGVGLLGKGAHLIWAARRPSARLLRYFAALDGLWVALTLGLITLGLWITAPAGIAASLAVAAMVATLGTLQWRAAR